MFNVLLQILDDGRLTDSKGRTVNFSNTIIIMTSNIGSDKIMHMLAPLPQGGKSEAKGGLSKEKREKLRSELMSELQTFFRPEFLNRIDDIIIFEPISAAALENIVTIQLDNLAKKLRQEKGITLTVTDAAKKLLADRGYDPLFGARPLKRTIQNLVLDELAMQILERKIQDGNSVTIDTKDGEITITN
ncbi:MAG: ATP-dependent Clp protease ATP-binding subunit [Candidatus Peribacteria bacterium]|nr:MAG: ATP-dependent Clp protease ATP-binding subunit [Candidatus Peribacteria bacterium]